MRIPVWVCNACKCLLESMPWCECPLGSMSWRECPLVGMQWMQMPPCGYIMTRMLWCKHNLFKNSLYFQNKASSAPKTKIFSKLDLLFMKSHLLFDFRLSKKLVITVRNLRMGHWLGIWWFGSKDLFSQFGWAKGVVHSRGLFLEKWILWKSSILKRFIFLVFEYGILIGVKTHRDRLKNLGKKTFG